VPAEPVAIVVVAIQLPDQTPLVQVHLAGDGSGLLLDATQGRHEDRQQQRNNRDNDQKLDEGESMSFSGHDLPPVGYQAPRCAEAKDYYNHT
jgi:hypothetical protein